MMIIFIAMVLTAGIVAYVILSTGSQLQIKSGTTGEQTIGEISTGIKISTIEGHNTSGLIDKVVIIITPRPGSPSIDLGQTLIELSNTSAKYILKYNSSCWVSGKSGVTNIFTVNAFSTVASDFGVLVLKDDDSSCGQNLPVINRGDSIMLTLNTTVIFNGIAKNENIEGNVIPEEGAWGIIDFRAPSTFAEEVLILQED